MAPKVSGMQKSRPFRTGSGGGGGGALVGRQPSPPTPTAYAASYSGVLGAVGVMTSTIVPAGSSVMKCR